MSDNDDATVPDEHEDDLLSVVVSDYESFSEWEVSDFEDDSDDSRSLSDFNGSDSDLRLLLSKTGRKKSERKYFKISCSVARRIARKISKFTRNLKIKTKFRYKRL